MSNGITGHHVLRWAVAASWLARAVWILVNQFSGLLVYEVFVGVCALVASVCILQRRWVLAIVPSTIAVRAIGVPGYVFFGESSIQWTAQTAMALVAVLAAIATPVLLCVASSSRRRGDLLISGAIGRRTKPAFAWPPAGSACKHSPDSFPTSSPCSSSHPPHSAHPQRKPAVPPLERVRY